VKNKAPYPWIYPLFCFAAHTGARRSEILRALVADVDFTGNTVLVREKKRSRGQRTTRRVPLTPFLKEVLRDWLAVHPGGPALFCHAGTVVRSTKRSRTTGHQNEKKRPSFLKGRMATVKKREQLAARNRPGAVRCPSTGRQPTPPCRNPALSPLLSQHPRRIQRPATDAKSRTP